MNRRIRPIICAAVLLAAGAPVALAQTPVDTGWTYQGNLQDAGAPATGTYDLRFSLYLDDAGTIPTGPVVDVVDVVVENGLFTARLDFGAQFTGYKNWLKIEVSPAGQGAYTELAPLQEITSAPQALMAQSLLLPYAASADAPAPVGVLMITNTNPTDGTALWGRTDGETGTGVYGVASSATGFNFAGLFECSSPDGRAVRAVNSAASGMAVAGRFANSSPDGISIWSTATSPTGTTYGLYGDSLSTSGFGVHGRASAATGGTYGVYGLSVSTGGIGVLGTASANTGATYGVYGQSNSTTGHAVYGIAAATSGFNYGGEFVSNSPDGRGVRGIANATTGLAVGGRFASASTGGIGVWSTASATSGACYGIYGDCASPAGAGGYFQNSAGGTALWANGLAKVKTLQILGGSDLAEPFEINGATADAAIIPGMVVVIDETRPGELTLSGGAYDTRVAGVISGANGLNPGMVMRAEGQEHADGQHPVAMTGRVWCWVDATNGAVKPGDRLTTSATPGHAMKASDAVLAPGSVIGKAMTGLSEGRGLVLVLVNLQ